MNWLALMGLAWGAEPLLTTDAQLHVLDNGLTVVLEEDRRSDQVALYLHYGVGSRDELEGEKGCAHLFEHVMFEGSANVPGSGFDDWLTQAGGWNNAFTSEDETSYYMVFPSGALDLALFLESDRMGFLLSGLTQDNLSNQQLVVLQERAQGYAEPHGRDYDTLSRLVYPAGHPYHTPTIGTVADIEGFQLDAVADFWRRHYRPQNAVLGIAGNFDAEEALAKVRHWFSDVPDPGEAVARVEEVTPGDGGGNGLIEDQVEDWTAFLTWETVPHGHPDEPALDLLSGVLSGGRGTRLDDRLYYQSEKATDVAAFTWNSELSGLFLVRATTDRGTLRPLEKSLLKEVKRLRRGPPTEEELDLARRRQKSGLLQSLETPADRVGRLVDCVRFTGQPDCLEAQWALYEAVTPEDLTRVAERYLAPERLTRLSVVPGGGEGALPGATPVELP